MSREPQDSWLLYAIGNVLILLPGTFFMWLAYQSQEVWHSPTFTFVTGLIGGGLLVWAYIAIGERRGDR